MSAFEVVSLLAFFLAFAFLAVITPSRSWRVAYSFCAAMSGTTLLFWCFK